MPLFPRPQVVELSVVAEARGRVAGTHSEEPELVLSTDGRKWVRKPGKRPWSANRPHTVVAEGIAFVLALRVGARVPKGAIERDGECSRWMSEFVPLTVPWEQAAGAHADGLPELGRVLAVDAIVGNEDRHAENVLLEGPGSDGRYRTWAIDFANGASGSADTLDDLGLRAPGLGALDLSLPFELMEDELREAALALAAIPSAEVAQAYFSLCRDAGSRDSPARLAALLHRRLQRAPAIVNEYWTMIRGAR